MAPYRGVEQRERELVRELFGLNHFGLITSGRGPYRDTLAGKSSIADERVAVTLALNPRH
jgi:hypothetical protein